MKTKISDSVFVFFRIWGAAWLAFLISFVPMYIWRGKHGSGTRGEEILLSVIGLVFGFLFVLLLQLRDEGARGRSIKDSLTAAGGGIGIYTLLWVLLDLPTKNNFIIAVLGRYLACLIGKDADGCPTFAASMLAALVFDLIYFLAIWIGAVLARKKHLKFLGKLKKDS